MTDAEKKDGPIVPGDQIETIFEAMAIGGRAKGTPAGFDPGSYAVFTQFTAPGDRAIVRVSRVVKRYVEADLVELLEPGPDRAEPICEYFGKCGGCTWQHLNYPRQLIEKADIVGYVLARNGLDRDFVKPCEPSDHPAGYRSRADLRFVRQGDRLRGGFLRPRSHDLLDVERCPLLVMPLSDAIPAFKGALAQLVAHVPEDWPFTMRILHDSASGAVFGQPRLQGSIAEGLIGTYRLADGVMIDDEEAALGFDVDGMTLRYDPFCFTQVNLFTNHDLVAAALQSLDLNPTQDVLELYAGIGNFTLPIAKRARRVLAVESSHASIRYSALNAKSNGLGNVDHLQQDATQACRTLVKRDRDFSAVLVDPPRVGMGQQAVHALCALEPRRIVIVSCHPDTLAKDLKRFTFRGYRIESIQPFDMFGQTFHVETVTTLVTG